MKRVGIVLVSVATAFVVNRYTFHAVQKSEEPKAMEVSAPQEPKPETNFHEVAGIIAPGETLSALFEKHGLALEDLPLIRNAAEKVYRLRNLVAARPYTFIIDGKNQVLSFVYGINDDSMLRIVRTDADFRAEKVEKTYERRIASIGGIIHGNLVSSMGEGDGKRSLAIMLADIFTWNIDFMTDVRNGDTFKIIVEELYEGKEFKKYGRILAAEFINNGARYDAYWYEHEGGNGYYDRNGKSLRRAFLKAPLNFRRISSRFSNKRFHPILKIYRPHYGVDFEAPLGTPVSATGKGVVTFVGPEGDYGNLVVIKHTNGYQTFYAHLSRFAKGIAPGVRVTQGKIIGYVGSTGLATSNHLHYEMQLNNRFINPLKAKVPFGKPIPKTALERFAQTRNELSTQLAAINPSMPLARGKEADGAAKKEHS